MYLYPHQPAYGQIMKFHRQVIQDLLQAGYSVPMILKMSVSKALLARFGSADAVDKALEPGAFKGVKASSGEFTKHRVFWKRTRRELENEYLAALAALNRSIERCRAVGVLEVEIKNAIEIRRHPEHINQAA